MQTNYDLLIIGAGPGGMTAAIYAKRAGLDVAIIEKSAPGGALLLSSEVSNYTGIEFIHGVDLAEKMYEHVVAFKVPFIMDEVKKISLSGSEKVVKCYKNEFVAKAIIIATGAQNIKLGLENEKKFIGHGVSYCATCDGALFKGKDVAIVGGGNSAIEECLYLSGIVNKVYLINRRDELRAEDFLTDRLENCKNVEYVWNSTVTKLEGEDSLQNLEVTNLVDDKKNKIDVSGLFISIGRGADTDFVDFEIKKDAKGYILTDENMQTNVDGVYAVGDIRSTPLRQIITACSDGAIAATSALAYIKK